MIARVRDLVADPLDPGQEAVEKAPLGPVVDARCRFVRHRAVPRLVEWLKLVPAAPTASGWPTVGASIADRDCAGK